MKTIISVLIALLAGLAMAAGQVKITFPDASGKTIWVLADLPTSMPPGGREFAVKAVNLDIPDGFENGTILILDKGEGNVALKGVSAAKSGWTLSESDWRIAEAIIQVDLDGKPLNAGMVIVDGGGRQIGSTISQGEAKLFNVPVGQIQVTVKFGEVGAEKISPSQTLTLSLERTETVPTRKILITSSAESGGHQEKGDERPPGAKEPAKGETAPPPTSEEDEAGGILAMCGSFILWLLVLVGVAALLLFAIRYLKSHQGKVAGGLQSLGIQIPDGSDTASIPVSEPASKEVASAAPVVQPGHCPYCGQPESQCVCQPAASPSVATAAVAQGAAHRLVSDSGVSLSIPDGVSIIGREAGSAQLVVSDPTVSRIHAEIEKSGGRIVLRDKGSSNGTFVNGAKISGDTEIRIGDTVQFGAVRMRVEA
jgi:hypothetical protein